MYKLVERNDNNRVKLILLFSFLVITPESFPFCHEICEFDPINDVF